MTRECEDAISRKAVLKAIKNLYPDIPFVDINGARLKWLRKYEPYFECEKVVEQLPSVTPQQKIGQWLRASNGTLCSICRGYAIEEEGADVLTDYCPWCGAKMQGVENDKESGKKTK